MLFLPLTPRRSSQSFDYNSADPTPLSTADAVPTLESRPVNSQSPDECSGIKSLLPIPAFGCNSRACSAPVRMTLSPEIVSDPTPKDEEGWLRRASLNAARNQRLCSTMSADTSIGISVDDSVSYEQRAASRSVSFDGCKEISFYHVTSPVGEVLHTTIPTKTFDGCSALDSARDGVVREFDSVEDLLNLAERMSCPPTVHDASGQADAVSSNTIGRVEAIGDSTALYQPSRRLRPIRFGFEEEREMNISA
uniref:Uncharacterized protein n=1 Tax=Perkinsus chesapeaki TaxID=330153 RepID=A7YXN8_PERCH|nr:unknown [Perkinsus chesapeaki]